MKTVNLTQLQRILPVYFDMKLPLYLWGKPSSGKTSMIRQFAMGIAKSMNLEYSEKEFGEKYFTLKVIPLSQFDASDLRGMPVITEIEGKKVTEFIPGSDLPRNGQGIIFLDEFNLADDLVRAAAYQLVLEGKISNLNLPKGFWRVAASNSEQDYSDVNTTGLALLRRFNHLNVTPTVEEINSYFLSQNGHPSVIAYLNTYPNDLFPSSWDQKLLRNKANPFPSGWETISFMMNKVFDKKGFKKGDINNLVSSAVGDEVGVKFMAYLDIYKTVNIDDILEKPKEAFKKIKNSDSSLSLEHSIISSLASMWINNSKKVTPKKLGAVMGFLDAERQVLLIKLCFKKRSEKLIAEPLIRPILAKIGEIFN